MLSGLKCFFERLVLASMMQVGASGEERQSEVERSPSPRQTSCSSENVTTTPAPPHVPSSPPLSPPLLHVSSEVQGARVSPCAEFYGVFSSSFFFLSPFFLCNIGRCCCDTGGQIEYAEYESFIPLFLLARLSLRSSTFLSVGFLFFRCKRSVSVA